MYLSRIKMAPGVVLSTSPFDNVTRTRLTQWRHVIQSVLHSHSKPTQFVDSTCTNAEEISTSSCKNPMVIEWDGHVKTGDKVQFRWGQRTTDSCQTLVRLTGINGHATSQTNRHGAIDFTHWNTNINHNVEIKP